MRSRSLPRITIPVACSADWNAMRPIEPDGRARLCGACDRPVYDTRSLTRGDLRRLILKHEGDLPCLRLHRRPDGTVISKSCFAPVLRAGRFLWLNVALAAVAFWSMVFAARSWARRPAQSIIESADSAEAEGRKLPFIIKPPDDSESDWENALGRPSISHKPRAKKPVQAENLEHLEEVVTVTVGEMTIDDK